MIIKKFIWYKNVSIANPTKMREREMNQMGIVFRMSRDQSEDLKQAYRRQNKHMFLTNYHVDKFVDPETYAFRTQETVHFQKEHYAGFMKTYTIFDLERDIDLCHVLVYIDTLTDPTKFPECFNDILYNFFHSEGTRLLIHVHESITLGKDILYNNFIKEDYWVMIPPGELYHLFILEKEALKELRLVVEGPPKPKPHSDSDDDWVEQLLAE